MALADSGRRVGLTTPLTAGGEGPVGEAGGDVRESVGAVSGVDEVAEEHDVVADASQDDVVRGQGSEDSFEVVEVFWEGIVFESFAKAGGVEGKLDGRGVRDGQGDAAGGVFCRGVRGNE